MVTCEQCVAQASELAAGGAVENRAEGRCGWRRGLEARCSCCDKETRQGMLRVATRLMGRLAGKFGQGARIGDECLDLCREILAGTWS
jgi:hypothetical protein